MPYGYNGKILRVNLTEGKVASEELPETFYRLYFGGEGMIGYYLLKEVSAAIDPLGPQNKLVFAAGVMTGVPVGRMRTTLCWRQISAHRWFRIGGIGWVLGD